jgi:hypothetical protein
MKKISLVVRAYKADADAFDDFDDNLISETLDILEESLLSINEEHSISVKQKIDEVKTSMDGKQQEIINDFLHYYNYYK